MIVKAQSGFFTVETGSGLVVCQLRGRLKRGRAGGDLAAIGDRVRITALSDGSGAIEEVEDRVRALVRLDPRPQGVYQQVLLANPDQAVFVFACAHPNPKLRMLDRFLVAAEKQKIPAVIVANKTDLVDDPQKIFGMYTQIGYPVIYSSASDGRGLEELRRTLAGKISALAGPSGVGKSSLLNALQPGLGLAVSEISMAVIVANKTDLVDDPQKIFGMYTQIGYPVIYSSASDGRGLEELRLTLAGKISALAGPSGVGKSSLLNALQPGLGLAVSEISMAVNKGRHTTVTRELIPLEGGGYVADTPGWRSLALWDTRPEEMDAYFPELAPLVAKCQFSDCTHTHEPGCAVRAALELGQIHRERYISYQRLRSGED